MHICCNLLSPSQHVVFITAGSVQSSRPTCPRVSSPSAGSTLAPRSLSSTMVWHHLGSLVPPLHLAHSSSCFPSRLLGFWFCLSTPFVFLLPSGFNLGPRSLRLSRCARPWRRLCLLSWAVSDFCCPEPSSS